MSDVQIIAGKVSVGLWLTDDPIVPSEGYGGWQVVDRPNRPGLTDWTGRNPFQLTVPALLYDGGRSVEPDRRALEQLATGSPPEIVTLKGRALPVPSVCSGKWVIEDLQWSDERRRGGDRSLTRKHVTVVLREYVADTLLRKSTRSSRIGGHQVIRHYRVKKKDTLMSIAARELGSSTRWVDLATLNGLRSSGQLKTGMLLRLP